MDRHLENEKDSLKIWIGHLLRIWTSLEQIKNDDSELINVFKDLCSDKLYIMIYELFRKKIKNTVGFSLEDLESYNLSEDNKKKYKSLFNRLGSVNKKMEDRGAKKRLHYRNSSGSHLMSLNVPMSMFQHFGYAGDREWKMFTKGVAVCIGLMKILDNDKNNKIYQQIRRRIRGKVVAEHQMFERPTSAMFDFTIDKYIRKNRRKVK